MTILLRIFMGCAMLVTLVMLTGWAVENSIKRPGICDDLELSPIECTAAMQEQTDWEIGK